MSYSFTVAVKDGEVSVDVPENMPIPDGKFVISGHRERSEEHYNHSVGIHYTSGDGSEFASSHGQSAHWKPKE